jgi:putative ABC transport system permease protein
MNGLTIWLRWSWRDLRARWLQVTAIAIIIALGTGVFAGLGGQKTWRIDSYDLSYERLHMYDLRVELSSGSYVNGDTLVDTLGQIEGVAVAEPRMVTPTLVDASHDDKVIIVKGRLIGVDVSNGGPNVNGLFVPDGDGRTLNEADSGQNVAVLEYKFARHYDLKPGSPLRISGDIALDFVGAGHSPEYFMVMPDSATFFAEANFAVVFVPLTTAQRLTGREGLVDEALILLEDGADRDTVQAAVEQKMADAFPDVGADVTNRDDDPVYSTLYSDAAGDQQFWNALAFIFLLGAAMGAFNLAGRMVEAQRREIGIGMALGVPRRWIAFRPMLVGIQIALLGTVFGLVFGWIIGQFFLDQLESFFPLPYYDTPFYLPGYLRAIVIGVLMPFIATLIPVWRAVRVPPIDAILAGYLVAKGGGLNWLAHHVPLPGKSFTHMPIRNVLRSPWRTLLTVLGIAIAISMLVFVVGALDTYVATMDKADDAYRYMGRDRVLINLDLFYPVENGEITTLMHVTDADGDPVAARTQPALRLGGTLIKDGEKIDTSLELYDMQNAIWTPSLVEGSLTADQPGVIISEKAANDLGVSVGDSITLEHPYREGALAFRLVQSQVPVIGIHDNPLRPLSYMDLSAAGLMGLDGMTNLLVLEPAPGVTNDAIKLAFLTQPGVASVEPISDFSEGVETLLQLTIAFLVIMSAIVLLMAFLIAFNSTSISVDERVREIATMFAFGLPIRTVTRMQMVENALMGALATLIGILSGWGILWALFKFLDSPELDELAFVITVSARTILLAVAVGVIVVALTPLLSLRRMRRMDIPSTLRVME